MIFSRKGPGNENSTRESSAVTTEAEQIHHRPESDPYPDALPSAIEQYASTLEPGGEDTALLESGADGRRDVEVKLSRPPRGVMPEPSVA